MSNQEKIEKLLKDTMQNVSDLQKQINKVVKHNENKKPNMLNLYPLIEYGNKLQHQFNTLVDIENEKIEFVQCKQCTKEYYVDLIWHKNENYCSLDCCELHFENNSK